MCIKGLLAERQKKVSGESSNNLLRVITCSRTLGCKSPHHYKGVTDKLATAFTTAERVIERLERARIVSRVGDAMRDRVFCATALLDILGEPAQIKPLPKNRDSPAWA
jgi:hypothetical protein